MAYGAHESSHKEKRFIRTKLLGHNRAGHIVMFLIREVKEFSNMFLSFIAAIMQKGQWYRIIFYFSWSRENTKAGASAPEESMRFRQLLHRVLGIIYQQTQC